MIFDCPAYPNGFPPSSSPRRRPDPSKQARHFATRVQKAQTALRLNFRSAWQKMLTWMAGFAARTRERGLLPNPNPASGALRPQHTCGPLPCAAKPLRKRCFSEIVGADVALEARDAHFYVVTTNGGHGHCGCVGGRLHLGASPINSTRVRPGPWLARPRLPDRAHLQFRT
jgi:hypothetical protein